MFLYQIKLLQSPNGECILYGSNVGSVKVGAVELRWRKRRFIPSNNLIPGDRSWIEMLHHSPNSNSFAKSYFDIYIFSVYVFQL